jgi:predicted dehydrogenase
MNKQVKLALLGAGNRGQGIFGQYALEMSHRCKFTAVVEPDTEKRAFFAETHNIIQERCFANMKSFFAADIDDVDGVVIATLEDERLEPVFESMKKNYHILVEKPLSTNPQELIELYDATKDYAGIVIVCHQMRLAPGYKMIKELLDEGGLGEIVAIQHSENLSYSHMAHSFVRGFFNNSKLTPMLLAKSCHDMDILSYWTGMKAEKISSFGSLQYFTKANCPEGAPEFCLQGCPHYKECPYSVLKLYFEADTDPAYLRQMGVVKDKNHLRELLTTNRFGRCVFQTDNDVVDHQTVQIQFDTGATCSFTMCGHNGVERRMSKFSMTNGEIECSHGAITVWRFEPLRKEVYHVDTKGTHGGGDRAIMNNYVDAIVSGDKSILLTSIKDSLQGHLMVFAAEESRTSGRIIDMDEYEKEIRAGM